MYIHSWNNKLITEKPRQYIHRGDRNGFQNCKFRLRTFSCENLFGTVNSLMVSRHSAFQILALCGSFLSHLTCLNGSLCAPSLCAETSRPLRLFHMWQISTESFVFWQWRGKSDFRIWIHLPIKWADGACAKYLAQG